MRREVESRSAEETETLGRRVGAACRAGDVVALVGDLGAGKTCFARGLAAGLGVEERVTSPTFTILNLLEGGVPVAHFDLYRLDSPDLEALGWSDWRTDFVRVVEWADKVPPEALGEPLRIAFEVTGESARRLVFEGLGPRGEDLLGRLNLSP